MYRSLPQKQQPSPNVRRVGFRVIFSEAFSTFIHITACILVKPPSGPLHRRAFQPPHTLCDCSDYYRLEQQLPGGIRTHWKTVPLHGALTKQN